MMQFNDKDMDHMIRACEYYEHWVCGNHPTGYMKEEYSHLLKKLHNYKSEIDCPDCKCGGSTQQSGTHPVASG